MTMLWSILEIVAAFIGGAVVVLILINIAFRAAVGRGLGW